MKICPVCQVPNAEDGAVCRTCGSLLLDDVDMSSGAVESSYEVLAPGTSLQGGSLSIDRVLGQGGFGITYGGFDALSGERVAIKEFFPYGCLRRGSTVTPSHLLDATQFALAKANFLNETHLAIRFRHPHIVEVRAVFEENNTAYLVMEFLDGPTLHELVEQHGALSQGEALRYIEQIGRAIETLHDANLLHRDIKPENIVICAGLGFNPAARAVLLDFGSAREFAVGTTKHMTSVLTPGYAPLEQYGQRARFGRFTDIYALGATLYHLLTGSAPPQATDRASGIELLSPENVNPNVGHLVSEAVLWAMEIKVDARPQTVEEWIRALHTGRPHADSETSKYPEAASAGVKVLSGPNLEPVEVPLEESALRYSTVSYSLRKAPWRAIVKNDSTRTAFLLPEGDRASGDRASVENHDEIGRWYDVTVTASRLKWPKQCACCNLPCTTFLTLPGKTATWEVPYCPPCREHAERGHSIDGIVHSTAIVMAVIGAIVALAFEQWRLGATIGLLLPLVLLLANDLVARFLKDWVRSLRGRDCCEYRPAARYLGRRPAREGQRGDDEFRWRFRSRRFAEAFCDLNLPVTVSTDTAPESTEPIVADAVMSSPQTSPSVETTTHSRREPAAPHGVPLS